MATFTLRIDDTTDAGLADLAKRAGESKNSYISDVLSQHVRDELGSAYDPELMLAFFKADRFADLDADSKCSNCEYEFGAGGVWFGVGGDFRIYGTYCEVCVPEDNT